MSESADYKRLLDEAWELHQAKNAGYAGADQGDHWANFRGAEAFGISALDGCLVRMSDKYIRATNLRRLPSNERVGEPLRDTLRDLAAYALIAVCLLDEENAKKTDGQILMSCRHGVDTRITNCLRCKEESWTG
jgi:hypothetical protein